jgi:hypothetical protein
MPLHLLKLAVGVDDVEHLRQMRVERALARGGSWVFTRNQPRRVAELLGGGSIYWVIRGQIRARQRLTGFRGDHDGDGRRYCLIETDPAVVPTLPRACRPFQGWRYLPPDAAPADRLTDGAAMPEAMLAELRELGLI